ncbi:MAG: CxxxxCH/CxxCH domain-containing protein [Nitrospirae bacterium]|nr:MAG: CxxxxCH/CxxCH domain-containing protein [Nitrospirota bacterium]
MGEIIMRKVKGMNWAAKISLVLIFTLVFSTFMYQGLYKPKPAEAAVTNISAGTGPFTNGWAHATGVAGPHTITDAVMQCGAGTNRLLVVMVETETGTAHVPTMTITKGGGINHTMAIRSPSGRNQVYIGYFTESQIAGNTNSIVVTNTSGTAWTGSDVYTACFSDVLQATPVVAGGTQSMASDTGTVTTFALSVATATNGMVIVGNATNNAANAVTPPAGWTEPFDVAGTGYGTEMAFRAPSANPETGNFTWTAARCASAAVSLNPAPTGDSVNVTDGTDPAGYNVGQGSTNNVADGFTMATNANTAIVTAVTASLTNPANVSGIRLYKDNGVVGTYEAGTDTLLSTGTPGASVTFSGLSENLTTTAGNYLIVVDIAGGATISQTIVATVTGLTVTAPDSQGTITDSGTILTVIAGTTFTITTCDGCHGNSPVDSPGGVRNAATGRFPGSHNQHGGTAYIGYIVCTDCHVNNTVTRHRNAKIEFTTNFGGATGGTYSRANASAWFSQTNTSFAPGTCSNVYCHSGGTGGTANAGDTRTVAPNTSPVWSSVMSGCNTCHGVGQADGAPSYTNWTTKANSHLVSATHNAQTCNVCHFATTTTGNSITSFSNHANRLYDVAPWGSASFTYAYNVRGGTCSNISCHGGSNAVWGSSGSTTFDCVGCHSNSISAPNASLASGGTVTTRDDAVAEFGLTWGHKKSTRGAVGPGDCIVCHLEGSQATGGRWLTLHGDGYIDLRDPDGAGQVPIKDMSGADYRFVKYSVSYAAGSRWTTMHTANITSNIVTIKFCMACHDANGATNTTAWSSTGGTRNAFMPFGGVNLGASYTTINGAAANGGLINVAKQFWPSNSSRHPVGAPNFRAYPYSGRLLAPYNGTWSSRNSNIMTSAATPRTKSNSVVMVCDDCHTTAALPTTRTITAHGWSSSLRGTYFVSAPTLCLTCHIQGTGNGPYNNTSTATPGGTHGSGSAFAAAVTRAAQAMNYCHNCHFSTNVAGGGGRPRNAQDVHGFNEIYNTSAGWTYGNANGMRPVAFIRNTVSWTANSPRPYAAPGITAGQANCGDSGGAAFDIGTIFGCNDNHTTYNPGGSY